MSKLLSYKPIIFYRLITWMVELGQSALRILPRPQYLPRIVIIMEAAAALSPRSPSNLTMNSELLSIPAMEVRVLRRLHHTHLGYRIHNRWDKEFIWKSSWNWFHGKIKIWWALERNTTSIHRIINIFVLFLLNKINFLWWETLLEL